MTVIVCGFRYSEKKKISVKDHLTHLLFWCCWLNKIKFLYWSMQNCETYFNSLRILLAESSTNTSLKYLLFRYLAPYGFCHYFFFFSISAEGQQCCHVICCLWSWPLFSIDGCFIEDRLCYAKSMVTVMISS